MSLPRPVRFPRLLQTDSFSLSIDGSQSQSRTSCPVWTETKVRLLKIIMDQVRDLIRRGEINPNSRQTITLDFVQYCCALTLEFVTDTFTKRVQGFERNFAR